MRQPNLVCDTMPASSAATHRSHPLSLWGLWLAIFLAIAPFIVRRIILLGDDNYLHWMAIDYLARCISLIGVILGFCSGLLQSPHPRTGWLGSLAVFLLLFAAEYAEQIFGCPVLEHYFRFLETSSWPPIPDPTLRVADLSLGPLVCCIRRGGRLSQIFIRSDRAMAPAATCSHHHKFRGICARSFHIGNCRHDGECLCERHLFWRRLLDNSPSFNLRRIPLPHRLSHIHEPLTAILGSRSINSARHRQAMTRHIGWLQ